MCLLSIRCAHSGTTGPHLRREVVSLSTWSRLSLWVNAREVFADDSASASNEFTGPSCEPLDLVLKNRSSIYAGLTQSEG